MFSPKWFIILENSIETSGLVGNETFEAFLIRKFKKWQAKVRHLKKTKEMLNEF